MGQMMGGSGGGGGMFGGANLGGSLGSYLGARKQRKTAKAGRDWMKEQLGTARGRIDEQMASLFGEDGSVPELYGGAREDLRTGAEQAGQTIEEGFGRAGDVATEGMEDAIGRLDPYAQQGAEAFDLYNKALQGGEGAGEALSAFQESTGYGFLRDEMQRATQRQFAGQGKAGSGNVLAALQERSAGIASQSFNDFMSQLMGSAEMGLEASGQQAGMQQGLSEFLANLETGGATAQAGIQQQLGAGLANLGVSEAALESQVRQGTIAGEYGMAQQAQGGVGEFYGLVGASQAQEMQAAGEFAHETAQFIGSMFTGGMGG